MAEGKVSKTAKRSAGAKVIKKRPCSNCKTGNSIVVQFAGYGKHGFYWVCEGAERTKESAAIASCGFEESTRG